MNLTRLSCRIMTERASHQRDGKNSHHLQVENIPRNILTKQTINSLKIRIKEMNF